MARAAAEPHWASTGRSDRQAEGAGSSLVSALPARPPESGDGSVAAEACPPFWAWVVLATHPTMPSQQISPSDSDKAHESVRVSS